MEDLAPSDGTPLEPITMGVSDVVRTVSEVAQRYLKQTEDSSVVTLGETVLQRLKEFADGKASLRDLNNALVESDRLSEEVIERSETEVEAYLERVANEEFADDFPPKEVPQETEAVVAVLEEEPVVAEENSHPVEDSFVASLELIPYEEGEGPVQMREEQPQGRAMPEHSFADICDIDFTKSKDLHNHPMRYVNLLGQVIKIFHTQRSIVLRFWDGHMLKYSKLPNLKLFLADPAIITDVVVHPLPELEAIPSDYYMDIILYGEWIELGHKLQSGDIVCITNVHMSLPKTCRLITAVLHEGNSHGRNIRLLSSEDAASDQMVKDLLVTAASLKDRPHEPSPPPPPPHQSGFRRAAEVHRQEQADPLPKQQPLKRPTEKQRVSAVRPSPAKAVDPPAKKAKVDTSPAKKSREETDNEKLWQGLASVIESGEAQMRRSIATVLDVNPNAPSTSKKERLRRSIAAVLDVDPDAPSTSKAANNRTDATRKEKQLVTDLRNDNGPVILSSETTYPVEPRETKAARSPSKKRYPRSNKDWDANPTEEELKELDDMFASVFGVVPLKEHPKLPVVADDCPIDVLADSPEEDVVVLRLQHQETTEAGVQTEVRYSTSGTQTIKSPPKKHKGVQVVVEEEKPATAEIAVQTDKVEPPVASPKRQSSRSPRKITPRSTLAEPGSVSSATRIPRVKQEFTSPSAQRVQPPPVPPKRRPVPPPRQDSLLPDPATVYARLRKRPSTAAPEVEQKPTKPSTPPKRARLSRSTADAPPPPPHRNLRSAASGATARDDQAPPPAPRRNSSRMAAGGGPVVAVKEEKPFAKKITPKKAKNPVSSGFCRTPEIRLAFTSNAKTQGKRPVEGPSRRRR